MSEPHEIRSGGIEKPDRRNFEMGLPLMWFNGPRASRVGCRLDGEKRAIKAFCVSQAGPGGG